MIKLEKVLHRDKTIILLKDINDNSTKEILKKLSTICYSKTYQAWYIDYSKASWNEFIQTGIAYQLPETNQNESSNTEHKDQTGTATSPKESDIAGIGANQIEALQDVHPSHGDSKGTHIHLNKGGRSIMYSGGNFFISIFYNASDIAFLKTIKGYWQGKIKKWIVKGSLENLEKIQARYNFWDDLKYNQIKELALNVECPYLVTLYRTAEIKDTILVQITGHKANTKIITKITERQYQKDEKRWAIPNDRVIVDQLKIAFTQDGATIIDRLPQDGFDYHKKEESYGQFKTRFLAKTEQNLKPIVERYLNTLIAFKRSQRTMTTYLGPFIKFVKQIGIEKIDIISSKDIDQYMAKIGGEKVSDGYLHNAFNAIMFYYRDVLRNNEGVLKQAKRPKKDDTLPKILSLGEVDRILRALDNLKHTTILYTFYSSGIRLHEILSLKVEDLWWERDQIFVHRGKGRKDRVVPFSGILKELLKHYFDEYKPIYWLFEGQDKQLPYSERSIQQVVKKAVKKAGINKKVSPHTLRHCFATHLMDGGTDVRYIQELLGHSDIKTTLIYTHVTNHSLAKIQSPLDKLMGGGQLVNNLGRNFKKPESLD